MKEETKKPSGLGSVILALIFLISPNVNVFDILPDFIAYLIIIKKLSYASLRAPFFVEARDAFKKLFAVTLIKMPASMIMTSLISQNMDDNDIRALFAISFAAIEGVLMISAVKNLFAAFSYLGQRSTNSSLIKPFPVNKSGTRTESPESLLVLSYVFIVVKNAASFLPTTLLLTKTVLQSQYYKTFNIAKLYPYAVVFGIIGVTVFGLLWMLRFIKYLRAIQSGGGLVGALESMMDDMKRAEIEKKKQILNMKFIVTLLAVNSVTALDLRFENLKNINLLPPFLFAFVMLFASVRLSRYSSKKILSAVLGSLFTLLTIIRYFLEFTFFSDSSYELLTIDSEARTKYIVIMAVFAVETVVLIMFTVVIAVMLKNFVMLNTGIEQTSPNYSLQDRDYHSRLKRKVYIFAGLCITLWLTKLTDTVLKFFSKNTSVSYEFEENAGGISIVRPEVGLVNEGLLPWFGIVVTAVGVAYILYSFIFASVLKEEIELKYSE